MGTNISKEKREELLKGIAEIRGELLKNKDGNTERLLSYLSDIEKDIDGKKYGLVFEEHVEVVGEILKDNVPVLTEDRDMKIERGDRQNFIIEGDNLASLALLEKTHKEKIDLIYIDPPYNTGNKDFVYDDAYLNTEDKFKHSKWLSFMKARLIKASKLLSQEGVIFISIDDNEQAQLKILCDEIFGEDNFISVLHWKKKKQPSFLHGQVAGVMEYLLVYAKNRLKAEKISLGSPTDSNTRVDNATNQLSTRHIKKGIRVKLDESVTVIKKGVYKNKTMSTEFLDDVYIEDGRTLNDFDAVARYRDSQERIDTFCEKDVLFITKNYGFRRDKTDEELSKRKPITDLLLDWGDNQDSDKELREIFGAKVFGYPKPILLIKNIVKAVSSKKDLWVLDFFAGSGTTGHAVMKLNREDGGSRRFILCTNNENDICRQVTYERIKRVIEKEDYEESLKYYKVDFVPVSGKQYYEYADKLLSHIKELVELENGVDFDKNDRVAICLSEEELISFIEENARKSTYSAVYLGSNVALTPECEERIKEYNIEIKTVPDYYYGDLKN